MAVLDFHAAVCCFHWTAGQWTHISSFLRPHTSIVRLTWKGYIPKRKSCCRRQRRRYHLFCTDQHDFPARHSRTRDYLIVDAVAYYGRLSGVRLVNVGTAVYHQSVVHQSALLSALDLPPSFANRNTSLSTPHSETRCPFMNYCHSHP